MNFDWFVLSNANFDDVINWGIGRSAVQLGVTASVFSIQGRI